MIEERSDRRQDIKIGSERSFGLVFALVFVIIAFWPVIKGDGGPRFWAIEIALLLLVVGYVWPIVLRPLNIAWFRLGLVLSGIIVPAAMALLYVTTFLPVSLALRLAKSDPLGLKWEPNRDSYWILRDTRCSERGAMKRQF